jgi:hypothetical protein
MYLHLRHLILGVGGGGRAAHDGLMAAIASSRIPASSSQLSASIRYAALPVMTTPLSSPSRDRQTSGAVSRFPESNGIFGFGRPIRECLKS